MKKIISIVFTFSLLLFFYIYTNGNSIEKKRVTHLEFLKNSPFKETLNFSKKERKSHGIPPNKYYEREWELTMNPLTGAPEPQKVLDLQEELLKQGPSKKSPGDAVDNPWIERGPNNVGGRTRAILFDPNDPENKRVFAGGVSGGLWVNEDITDENFGWTRIVNIPGNLSVSCIASDPRDSNTLYVGTGEIYTAGAATGNGLYKSEDAGVTWEHVIGGSSGDTFVGDQILVPGFYFIQDVIVRDYEGVSEVYIAVGASFWEYGGSITTFLGFPSEYGVYKSIDKGATWTKPEIPTFNDHVQLPNDFEISSDNTIWLTTTGNYFGDNGGAILNSEDGDHFTEIRRISSVGRTEIEFSSTNPSKAYILAAANSGVPVIYKTTDAFATSPVEVSLPEDSDTDIDAEDFTRGQAFYDLMIEVDPTDDDILYVGGINLFRSEDGAISWDQISKWHASKPGSYATIHADQHAMTFRPGSSDQAVFGNDGGIYYSNALSSADKSSTSFTKMVNDYNVTQFYTAAIAPTISQEFFLGGTQDNGTPFFDESSKTGPDSSTDISGGDGAACFVDQVGESYLIVSYVYNNSYSLYNLELEEWRTINSDENGDGDFINQAALDSNLDIMYANGSSGESIRLYRYSDLTTISESGSATKTTLSDDLLDASPTAITVSKHTITSSTLLVGTETGKLLRVLGANSDPEWEDISAPGFLGSISDVEFGTDENEIYVTFHNYGVSNIWYTIDAGVNWIEKEGDLPDIPVKAILASPIDTDEVIIGTELGVWKTLNWNDTNPEWTQTYNGMSDVKVTDLQYRSADFTVLAATFGRGLFTGVFEANGPGFSISTIENRKEILETKNVTFTIDYSVFEGFSEEVSMSLTGIPTGASVDFTPESPIEINSDGSFEVTIIPNEEYEIRTYAMVLEVSSVSQTKILNFYLDVKVDTDNDGISDDDDPDDDNDGVLDGDDNSPFNYNPDQLDTDSDGEGDASDIDDDNDGVLDVDDNCIIVYNPEQLDIDTDMIGDICDDEITISQDIPKGFTPNNDGINDIWLIEKIEEIYPNNELEVYNRSGKLVYKVSPYINDWSGERNIGGSQKLPIGSYMYILKSGDPIADFYPVAYVKKGWIYIKY